MYTKAIWIKLDAAAQGTNQRDDYKDYLEEEYHSSEQNAQ
jgi:hypothetical protein